MKASARDRLLKLADYLGATVYCDGRTWYILHYGVGGVNDNPVGHSSWDCLGRLIHVATASEATQGHGCTFQEMQDVIQCPYNVTREGGRMVLMLPDGMDGTTYTMLARVVHDDFHREYGL